MISLTCMRWNYFNIHPEGSTNVGWENVGQLLHWKVHLKHRMGDFSKKICGVSFIWHYLVLLFTGTVNPESLEYLSLCAANLLSATTPEWAKKQPATAQSQPSYGTDTMQNGLLKSQDQNHLTLPEPDFESGKGGENVRFWFPVLVTI